jgi:hypothetical protein
LKQLLEKQAVQLKAKHVNEAMRAVEKSIHSSEKAQIHQLSMLLRHSEDSLLIPSDHFSLILERNLMIHLTKLLLPPYFNYKEASLVTI